MMTLVSATHCPPPEWLDSPGGFLWWYVDLRDADGNGAVLIWSFGLPFLPGLASAERAGHPVRPGDAPSLNVVLYRDGRPDFYVLRRFHADEATWSPRDASGVEAWRFGDSHMRSERKGGLRRVCIALDLNIPVSRRRLCGEVTLEGPEATLGAGAPPLPDAGVPGHHWAPLVPCGHGEGTLRLEGDGSPVSLPLRGDAYHDRNASPRALHRLGIAHWIWGRARTKDGARIHYLVWPEDGSEPLLLGVDVNADGSMQVRRDLDVSLRGGRRTLFGMTWWPEIAIRAGGQPWLDVQHGARVDDGPFYLRFAMRTRDARGLPGEGWGELVRPARIDLPQHRPLVRMAVDHGAEGNSVWLPLFSGPRKGRIRRLVRRSD